MARATVAAVIVLMTSVHYSYGQNVTDASKLGRATNFFIPRTCAEPPLNQIFTGVHEVQPSPGFGPKFEVLCDQDFDKGGWIVIQNRFDGSTYFDREWAEYKDGFGNLKGEFWLGLDKIHDLTYSQKFELVFLLTDWAKNVKFEKYSEFRVAGPGQNYAITVLGTGTGDAGDGFTGSAGMPFSTIDADKGGKGCPGSNRGAWWYPTASCGDSNLNGLYQVNGAGGTDMQVNFWAPLTKTNTGLKSTRIMIRPKK